MLECKRLTGPVAGIAGLPMLGLTAVSFTHTFTSLVDLQHTILTTFLRYIYFIIMLSDEILVLTSQFTLIVSCPNPQRTPPAPRSLLPHNSLTSSPSHRTSPLHFTLRGFIGFTMKAGTWQMPVFFLGLIMGTARSVFSPPHPRKFIFFHSYARLQLTRFLSVFAVPLISPCVVP